MSVPWEPLLEAEFSGNAQAPQDWPVRVTRSAPRLTRVARWRTLVIAQSWVTTDVGKQRTVNEDCHYVDNDLGLFLVLDGMGGHRAGEVASRLAMETIASFYKKYASDSGNPMDIFENYDPSFTYQANLLRQAAFTANRIVLEKSIQNEEFQGMGSTVAGVAMHDSTASMINVGDSRTYLIRNGRIEQISRDHTLAEDQVERGLMTREEARDSQLKHILSSVIGVDSRIRIHMDELIIFPGDILLLCTDGLTAVMEDGEVLDLLTRETPGQELLNRIVEEVNLRGGPDNVTLAVAVFSEAPAESKIRGFLGHLMSFHK
jgi:PPM family protein phosphatase